MKKLGLIVLVMSFFIELVSAQSLVVTTPQNKNIVLEEFTGIHCQYCPEGHAIAQQMFDENPGRVVLVNIHQGSFAVPSGSEPDYRTPFGDAIAGQTGLTGYPSGTVNRHVFPNLGANTALSRGAWPTAGTEIMATVSPVNVGASTSYNATTRELTVNVELFYTSNSSTTSNYINVALIQNNVKGPQTTTSGTNPNYIHKHMLRWLLTGQWGDVVTTTTQGIFVQRTYTYTVPADYINIPCVVTDCDVAVFVAESQQEVLNGVQVPAINGTTLVVGSITSPVNTVATGSPQTLTTFNLNAQSLLAGSEDFNLTLSRKSPVSWNSNLVVNGTTYDSVATVAIANGTPANIALNVTPGNTPFVSSFLIKMQSVSNPNAPVIYQELYVISNITDLVVHNQGKWGNGQPSDFEPVYFEGLAFAGNTHYASAPYRIFMKAAEQNQLAQIKTIYFNAGWTTPTLTNENVAFFTNFLNAGNNLFIAGQDIGWDTWDAAGNGNDVTKAFYTNYLHAQYKSDGSGTNNTITSNPADTLLGAIGVTPLSNPYGSGNMYPDEIAPTTNAINSFFYKNLPAKGALVHTVSEPYKVAYCGFEPSMMTDVPKRKAFFKKINDWFHAPVQLQATTVVNQNASCNGVCDGKATVTATSGHAPYQYLWSDPNHQTTATATGLCAGDYTVTVTDNANLSVTLNVTITQPAALATQMTATVASCDVCADGTATVTVSGGTNSYTYLWNDANHQTTATATALLAGKYSVTVTDVACLNTITDTITVGYTLVPELQLSVVNIQNPTCNAQCTGSAEAQATGGIPPYSYSWNNGAAQTTGTNAQLCSGDNQVKVTDAANHVVTYTVKLTQPDAMAVNAVADSATCAACTDGKATATVSGGSGQFSYLWNDAAAQTTATATGLIAGEYTVTVKDLTCNTTLTATVTISVKTGINDVVLNRSLNIFPNPADNHISIQFENQKTTSYTIQIFNVLGKEIYSASENGKRIEHTIATGNFAAGMYLVKISDGKTSVARKIQIKK